MNINSKIEALFYEFKTSNVKEIADHLYLSNIKISKQRL